MIIDFHTHLFPEKIAEKTIQHLSDLSHVVPFSNGTKQGLLDEMKEGDVNLSVVLPVVTRPEQFSSITRFACDINEHYGSGERKLLSFGGIHPDSANYKDELRELKNMGFKGVKLHPDYQGTVFNDIKYKRLIEEATKLDLIVSVHAGVDVGLPDPVHCSPKQALEVLQDVKPTKLILAHLGGWKCWDEVEQLLVGQDVYLDTAVAFGYCPKEQLERIVKQHGSDKILFATDSPWSGQKESVEALLEMDIEENAKQQILYKNAATLLQLQNI